MRLFQYILILGIGLCLGYIVGLYNGMNSIFLSETSLSAGSNIHILKYLDTNHIDKAKSVISTSLNVEMAAIQDITANKYSLSKAVTLYKHYKTMISLNTNDERINDLKKRYESYVSESNSTE